MGRSADSTVVDVIEAEAEQTPPDTVSESSAAWSRRWIMGLLTVIVLVVALLVAVTIMVLDVRSTDADATRDALVVDTARQVVVNLTTLNYDSADADIDRILVGTTGSFRDQFTGAQDSFRQVLQSGQVKSSGEVKEAGLISADDDSAHVLVAAASTVKNTDAPDGEIRVYRMNVSLDRIDGSWLVSNVEFVS